MLHVKICSPINLSHLSSPWKFSNTVRKGKRPSLVRLFTALSVEVQLGISLGSSSLAEVSEKHSQPASTVPGAPVWGPSSVAGTEAEVGVLCQQSVHRWQLRKWKHTIHIAERAIKEIILNVLDLIHFIQVQWDNRVDSYKDDTSTLWESDLFSEIHWEERRHNVFFVAPCGCSACKPPLFSLDFYGFLYFLHLWAFFNPSLTRILFSGSP